MASPKFKASIQNLNKIVKTPIDDAITHKTEY